MGKQYILIDGKGNKVDVIPVLLKRPKLKNFTFLFAEGLDIWETLTTAEVRALLFILLKMRRQNLFSRQDLNPYYSKQRLTQILQDLIQKKVIKRLGYGEYMLSPWIALKGSSDLLPKLLANWEGDVVNPQEETETLSSVP